MLDTLAVLSALAIATLATDGCRIRRAGFTDYALAHLLSGVDAVTGLSSTIAKGIDWPDYASKSRLHSARSGVIGVLLSLPLLFVFGSLLGEADAVFGEMVDETLSFDVETLVSHVLLIGFLTWTLGGLIKGTLLPRDPAIKKMVRPPRPSLGIIEVGLPLALLNLLFLIFVAVQVRYLFGDHSLVETTIGLTYAEYARQGFLELVTVVGLVLPVILVADWALSRDDQRGRQWFRVLASVQLILVAVIMTSAVQRMLLYQGVYGLTELRLYATAFMAWLAVVLIWLIGTVLRNRRDSFAFGALVTAFLTLAALNLLNPEALIVRINTGRAAVGEEFDVEYATSLSADAVPTLLARLPLLEKQDRCIAAARILERWSPPDHVDWRTWNRARAVTWRKMSESRSELKGMACEEPAQGPPTL